MEDRKKLRELKKEAKEYLQDQSKGILIEELERDKRHQNLVKLCAKAFAETDLSLKTGYEFYFTEPLVEFSEEKEGNKNFDLLLFDEGTQHGIFVECKTSIPLKGKSILAAIKQKIDLIREKLSYFSDILGLPIDLNRIEFVLCVYDIDSRKILDSMNTRIDEKLKDPHEIKLWIYRPHSQRIQLYQHHEHQNPNLTKMLLHGFGEEDLRSQFELPFCLSTHHYRIILLAIVGECYIKNLNAGIVDPKIIKRADIFEVLDRKISLGMSHEQKNELISRKISQVVKYGEKYQIFEAINEEEIKLNCKGIRLDLVKRNIEEKFFKRWIEEKSERDAEKNALEVFKKRKGLTQLTDFK